MICIFCDQVALVRAVIDDPQSEDFVTVGICEDHYENTRDGYCDVCPLPAVKEIDVDDGEAPLKICAVHYDQVREAWEDTLEAIPVWSGADHPVRADRGDMERVER